MIREFDRQLKEVHFSYLVGLFDRAVFGLDGIALTELTKMAVRDSHAQELKNKIDHLDLNGKFRETRAINQFGYCKFGHGVAREVGHHKEKSEISFICDHCQDSYTVDKPPVLKALEDMGETWNTIHLSPEKRAEIEKERNRKLVEQWSEPWAHIKGGQCDSTRIG